MRQPLFAGLVVDDRDRPVSVAYVGNEPCYVVDDDGFKRHIPSEQVDRQVFDQMAALIRGHEDILSAQAAKMLGQDDIFSRAILENQLKNINAQFQQLLQVGIPEEMRAYLGMTGFKVIINAHGDVLEVRQPGMTDSDNEDPDE